MKLIFVYIAILTIFFSCKKDNTSPEVVNDNPYVVNFQDGWNEISTFGENPGNLKMYLYQPANASGNIPVVVVLHGCSQDAAMINYETGWDKLAEMYKFYVIYAQQSTNNNTSKCFNWFLTSDQEKGQGEVASVYNMFRYLRDNTLVDNNKVFVTGFSAGAAMAVNLLACYPETFKAGAIFAGVPYKAATNATEAFTAMNGGVSHTAQEWGNLVRNADTTFTGPYPKIAVFHGLQDNVVNVQNAYDIEAQWTNLHTISTSGTIYNFNNHPDVSMRYFVTASNDTVVKTYLINNLMHALAIDPGPPPYQGGNVDTYAIDKNFYTTYWVAKFFNLVP